MLFAPPSIVSFPAPPLSVSIPSFPVKILSWLSPIIVSDDVVPITFSTFTIVWFEVSALTVTSTAVELFKVTFIGPDTLL